MRIIRISLQNIGPYIGCENTFEFDVKKDQNIILIGGKNGSGKTTLLNSIKLGLFGVFAFGYKSENSTYYSLLSQFFNYVEMEKKKAQFKIEIVFSIIENYDENIYSFSRTWIKNENKIDENLVITKNNNRIKDEEEEIIQTKLKEIMPPSVIDTMLFDGEEISKIITENKIGNYLKELISVNFNINIFEKMEDDIEFYINKEKTKKVLTTEEIDLLEYQQKFNNAQKKLKDLKDVETKFIKLIEETKFKLKQVLLKFENYGGLTDKEKTTMKMDLEILESNRRDNLKELKEFIENDLVFYLNKKLLSNIEEQILKERPIILLNYIEEIEEYFGPNNVKQLRLDLEKDIDSNNIKLKYNASKELLNKIDEIIKKINKKPANNYKLLLENSRKDLTNSKVYKKIISNNENANNNDLKILLDEMTNYKSEIDNLEMKIKETQKEITFTEQTYNLYLRELENYEKKFDSERKEENSFNVARNIMKVSLEFRQKQTKNILSKISEIAKMKFDEINKKENYVSKITIDSNTFNVILYDNKNIAKDISILSAGEKQLMISAIVWSVFKLAGRNNLFTFDTPLARLDKENRKLFVEKILCTISDQVLILSTNQEIVDDLLVAINSYVNKKYLIVNDENIGKTFITEGYFEVIK